MLGVFERLCVLGMLVAYAHVVTHITRCIAPMSSLVGTSYEGCCPITQARKGVALNVSFHTEAFRGSVMQRFASEILLVIC